MSRRGRGKGGGFAWRTHASFAWVCTLRRTYEPECPSSQAKPPEESEPARAGPSACGATLTVPDERRQFSLHPCRYGGQQRTSGFHRETSYRRNLRLCRPRPGCRGWRHQDRLLGRGAPRGPAWVPRCGAPSKRWMLGRRGGPLIWSMPPWMSWLQLGTHAWRRLWKCRSSEQSSVTTPSSSHACRGSSGWLTARAASESSWTLAQHTASEVHLCPPGCCARSSPLGSDRALCSCEIRNSVHDARTEN